MSSLFGGKSESQKTKHALGLDFQSAQYGNCIPVVFGQNKLAGNVIDYMDFRAIKKEEDAGGKGGSQKMTSYTYSASFVIGLCEGVSSVVNVFDGTSTKNLTAAGGIGFTGSQTQAVWSHLTGDHALNYSATSIACFQDLALGSSASLPNLNFEIAGRNQVGGGLLDANPADIITAICTDTQIGVKFSALGDLTQLRDYCTASGLLFSPVYDSQQAASSSIDTVLKYANCAPYFSEGVLKVVPYGDSVVTGNGVTYTPDLSVVASIGANDFITNGAGPRVTMKRKSPADSLNVVHVEYKDRSQKYRTIPVTASIDQDVVSTGSRTEQSESASMVTVAATARLISQNMLQRMYYIRNTYEFRLSWKYCYLEPTDIIALTDIDNGLNSTPVRITSISEDDHGMLQVEAEELPDGVGHGGTYATQAVTSTTTDAEEDPGPVTAPYIFRGPGFLVSAGAPEIWCAVNGANPVWAGCEVWISQTGSSYTYLTTFARASAYGVTTNTLNNVADPDTTSTLNVSLNADATLVGGTADDADDFVTLAMVNNEIISYQSATLAAGPSYNLGTRIRRGGYGTARTSHPPGSPFVRLNNNILRIPMDASQVGQTIYLKFLSFNVFGRGGRTLADETAYAYSIGANIEFPEVPMPPDDFTVTGVADGVNISWVNLNPAAVGATSIEISNDGLTGWTVLAQTGQTATGYQHAFTSGATFYYRARARGVQLSAGWSAYTSPTSATGVAATTAISAASAAAAAAQADADAAIAILADISSDEILSINEKPPVILDYDTALAEKAGLDTQADNLTLTAEKATYNNALSALVSYMGTLTSPVVWNNQTDKTTLP